MEQGRFRRLLRRLLARLRLLRRHHRPRQRVTHLATPAAHQHHVFVHHPPPHAQSAEQRDFQLQQVRGRAGWGLVRPVCGPQQDHGGAAVRLELGAGAGRQRMREPVLVGILLLRERVFFRLIGASVEDGKIDFVSHVERGFKAHYHHVSLYR